MRSSNRDNPTVQPDLESYHDESPTSPGASLVDDGEFGVRSETESGLATNGSTPKLLQAIDSYIPPSLKSAWEKTVIWVKGPDPPRVWKIVPFFPRIQHIPINLLDRNAPKYWHRFWLLIALYGLYLIIFIPILNRSAFSADVPGYGSPVTLGCGNTYWGANNFCGLDGSNCRPFENSTLAFRCPGNCLRVQALNPHAVGDQEVVYKPLVIGGPEQQDDKDVGNAIYRADSFICGSAIHAGFITNEKGGCGALELSGAQDSFASSKRNDIDSVGFDSNFPMSFRFLPGTHAKCEDLRWPLLAVSLIFSIALSLFTTSPAVFFWSIFTALFFHTALVSDPPGMANYYGLVSIALGRFLPAAFCGFVIYKYCAKRALTGLTAQIEKTVLWLGACWVGCLNNYTFDKIPIQRLTPHDIQAQPGAIPALIVVVLSILFIAIGQAWGIRVEGRMPMYLGVYGIMVFVLLIFVAVPGLDLRIHHYILALLLVPGTAMQNRPSLLYQGLLVGLFINGIARWGFDSIMQTPDELRGDGQLGSKLPNITDVRIGDAHHNNLISFDWAAPPRGYDGLSILVNDVERYRGYDKEEGRNFTWQRQAPEGKPEYFRFGFLSGSVPGDFTKAGIWQADGEWIPMKPGPS